MRILQKIHFHGIIITQRWNFFSKTPYFDVFPNVYPKGVPLFGVVRPCKPDSIPNKIQGTVPHKTSSSSHNNLVRNRWAYTCMADTYPYSQVVPLTMICSTAESRLNRTTPFPNRTYKTLKNLLKPGA